MKALFARVIARVIARATARATARVTENKSGLIKWISPPKTVFD